VVIAVPDSGGLCSDSPIWSIGSLKYTNWQPSGLWVKPGCEDYSILCGAAEWRFVVAADFNQFGSMIDYWLNQG
jgi:hypothetical protein